MIARVWTGQTRAADANAFALYLDRTVIKAYRSMPGNRGVLVLRRLEDGRATFTLVPFWDSIDDVRRFSGGDVDAAAEFEHEETFLLWPIPRVSHYDVLPEVPVVPDFRRSLPRNGAAAGAREVMDGLTAALFGGRYEEAARAYAPDAVASTPDDQALKGPDAIVGYFREYLAAFPDAEHESIVKHDTATVAIEEWTFRGTHTGDLPISGDRTIPGTGQRVSVRSCDVATVVDGRVVSHHLYVDQLGLMAQLGVPATLPA